MIGKKESITIPLFHEFGFVMEGNERRELKRMIVFIQCFPLSIVISVSLLQDAMTAFTKTE